MGDFIDELITRCADHRAKDEHELAAKTMELILALLASKARESVLSEMSAYLSTHHGP